MKARLVRFRRRFGPVPERLDGRCLLSTITLTAPNGPITALTLGDDGSFQVQHTGFSNGQVFPTATAPGDAGIFIRQADGTIDGLDVAGRGTATAANHTNAIGLHPISFVEAPDGQGVTLIADNSNDRNQAGNRFQLTQVTTFRPGDDFFRVDDTIKNQGSAPLTLDLFAAADMYLADSDKGVGYFDGPTGAVGGTDASGAYHIFVQPNPAGGLASSAYQEDYYDNIWHAIGAGDNFNNTILPPSGNPPYSADPNYLDNGAGLEWKGVTIAPGASARISYFWSFGASTSVPPDALLTAGPAGFAAVAGQTYSGPVATFQDADPSAQVGDYSSVTIDWGDGASSAGTIVPNPAGGFLVNGTHTYSRVQSYPLSIFIQDSGGAATTAHGTARVADTLTATGRALNPTATLPYSGTVATFQSADPSRTADAFQATIHWGDGTTSDGTIAPDPGGGFDVDGTHTFAKGRYATTIIIHDSGGASATATDSVVVADRPLIVNDMPMALTATADGASTSGFIAYFHDPDPSSHPTDYRVTIDWGDGTPPTLGTITPIPDAGPGAFYVGGPHLYPARTARYPVRVTIDQPFGPPAGTVSTLSVSDPAGPVTNPPPAGPVANPPTAMPVADPPPLLSAILDPASDTGPSDSDGITNDPTPRFLGLATPGSTVALYATFFAPLPGQPFNPALARPIGQTTAGADGNWGLTTAQPLPDGAYVVFATATAADGQATTIQARDAEHLLVIDTVGPKIIALGVDPPSGRINLTVQDDRSGLDLGSVLALSNYNLTKVPLPAGQHFAVTGAALAPKLIPPGPFDPLPVILTTDDGRRLHHGRRYVLSIASGGVQDLAGNALDGEFSGTFPTGDGRPGGAFHVRILTDGRQVFPFQPYQGPDPLTLRVAARRVPAGPLAQRTLRAGRAR